VGRHLVSALLARGDRVIAADLSAGRFEDGVVAVAADVRDRSSLLAAFEGVDAVFHNASVVHTRNNRVQDVRAVNVTGTRNVIDVCRSLGVRRLVYVSSASAVYEGKDIEHGDETLDYASTSQAPYADSKIDAEKMILAANDEALATCAIRPHVVFGPGDTRFLPAIVERAKAGKLKLGVGRAHKLSDFTYVSNLIDALLAAEERLSFGSVVAGQAYFVTNGEPTQFWGFIGDVLRALGYPPLKGRVPYALAYAVAAIVEGYDTLRGGTLGNEKGLSRFAVRYMCTHHYFDISKARQDLEWAPRVSIAEGIRITCDELRAR